MWTTPNILLLVLAILLLIVIITAVRPSKPPKEVTYKERKTGVVVKEKVAAAVWMRWLYHNPIGEFGLYAIVKRRWLSSVVGSYMDSKWSAARIHDFVKDNGIDIEESQTQDFDTFNAFFTRKLKPTARPIDSGTNVLVSPADGKVLVYPSVAQADFIIKGHHFDVHSFLQDSSLSQAFADGSMAVIRLAPTDYHRFHAPIDAYVEAYKVINGACYSVSPIALRAKPDLFCLNERSYHLMRNDSIGRFVMSEVGATFVGSIMQTFEGDYLQKGQEKGFFKFGGSTIVLLFSKGSIEFDTDLVTNSQAGMETAVRMGESIGTVL